MASRMIAPSFVSMRRALIMNRRLGRLFITEFSWCQGLIVDLSKTLMILAKAFLSSKCRRECSHLISQMEAFM